MSAVPVSSSPPAFSLDYLFPADDDGQAQVASHGFTPYANKEYVTKALEEALETWRVSSYLETYKKATLVANQARKATVYAELICKQVGQTADEIIDMSAADAQERIEKLAQTLIGRALVSQAYIAISCSYTSVAHAYRALGQAQVKAIEAGNFHAKSHAREAENHPQACTQGYAQHATDEANRICDVAAAIKIQDPHVKAAIPKVEAQFAQAKAALDKAKEAMHKAAAMKVKAEEAARQAIEIHDEDKSIIKKYAKCAQMYAECAQKYTKAIEAHTQAVIRANSTLQESATACQAAADAALARAQAAEEVTNMRSVLAHARKIRGQAGPIKGKNALKTAWNRLSFTHNKVKMYVGQRAQPFTNRFPHQSTIKQGVFEWCHRHRSRLAQVTTHLACFVFIAPLCAMDAFYHAFWCTFKLGLLVLRGMIYIISFGRYGSFLQKQVSIRQVMSHAKKAAFFTLSMFFGPWIGVCSPKTFANLQARYDPTQKKPPASAPDNHALQIDKVD